MVADQTAAEQGRQPVAVGVAADLDHGCRGVADRALAPVGQLRQAAARAVLEVQLELAGVERVAGDLAARQVVLAQTQLAAAVADRQRVGVLRAAGGRDLIDDLERLGDLHAGRDIEECAAAPERGTRRLEFVAVEQQPSHVVALEQLGVLVGSRLERAEDHPARRQLRVEFDVHDRGVALHEHAGAALTRQDRWQRRVGRVAARLERVEVEVLEGGLPEPRPAPARQLERVIGDAGAFAQHAQRSTAGATAAERCVQCRFAGGSGLGGGGLRHGRQPPHGSGRSPLSRAARPARSRRSSRSARPA